MTGIPLGTVWHTQLSNRNSDEIRASELHGKASKTHVSARHAEQDDNMRVRLSCQHCRSRVADFQLDTPSQALH